jgi:hypothetical protein
VQPRPAKLVFKGMSPDKVAVTCISGCPDTATGQRMASSFPALKFEPGTDKRDVKLKLTAVGFDPQEVEMSLHPGPNDVKVELQPRTAG